jgi:pectate lyase
MGGASVSANAQTLYDFTDWDEATYSSTTTKNGLTVTATSTKTVEVSKGSKSIDGYSFTKMLKFGGGGAEDNRYASITIPANGTVTAYYISAKSGASRTMNIAIGTFNNVVASNPNDGTSVGSVSYTYEGTEPTTVYVYSAGSGINLYGIVYTQGGSIVVDDVTVTPATEGTPYTDVSTHAVAQDLTSNQMEVQLTNGDIKYYNTKNLSAVNIDKEAATVTLVNGDGESDIYYGDVSHIGFAKKADSGQEGEVTNNGIAITECKGWHESCYIEWTPISAATSYNVYVKGGNYANYTKIDGPLVRNYGSYARADMVGLIAGTYSMKVVGVDANGNELSANGVATNLEVINYQRDGFAFLNRTAGVGAYNNDGSLKSGARVLYVTAATAKTITCDVIINNKGGKETYTGFQAILDGYMKGYDSTPITFRIIGTINANDMDSFSSSEEGLQIKSKRENEINVTIEGIGEDATIKGFGMLAHGARSLELRNFAVMLFWDDAISIDSDNKNVWIHHLDIFYGKPGSDSDQAKGDGSVDIKSDSQYVTVSYNHFWDAGKSSLCGMKSESGPNYISYDHNWFDHSDSRHPRVRTMSVHVWNNYFDGNSKYGVGVTSGSSAFVEGNYFRNCKFPMLSSLQGNDVYAGTSTYKPNDYGTFSGEEGGIIKSYGNVITGTQSSYWTYGATNILCKGSTKSASSMGINTQTHFDAYEVTNRNQTVPSSVKSFSGSHTYDNFDTNSSLMYTYTPDAAADVPAKLAGYYGAGRLNHGDFKWTFNNATDDTAYEVNSGLKSALQSYTSTLVGIYGDANQQGTGGGEGGNDNPDDPDPGTEINSDVICTFTANGPTNSAFNVTNGNYSNGKGTATVNGITYNYCLKLESTTSVKFTTTSAMKLTLVFGSDDTKYTIKVDGNQQTGSNGILTMDLGVGEHTLTKADTGNLFYIGLKAL